MQAVPETLKNMLLVMGTSGVFEGDRTIGDGMRHELPPHARELTDSHARTNVARS